MIRARAVAARSAVLVALVVLGATGCGTGHDAVATGGEFQFVAPHGQQVITYEPAGARGTLRVLTGDSLTRPGTPVGIQNFPGQVVVINIWGAWCGPCRAEMQDLQQLHATAGVPVLGIDVRDNQQGAADFVRDRGVTYPSIFDYPGRSLDQLHGYPRNTVPSTIVLDRQHRVAAVFLTAVRIGQLGPVVQRLSAEQAG